jgi:hypothetical protein
LRDEELLKKPDILPQMRFLLNDKHMFDLTVQLLLAGVRIVNSGSSEKDKIRSVLKQILEKFFLINNYAEMKAVSADLVYLLEEQIEVICTKDYYDAKLNNEFSF